MTNHESTAQARRMIFSEEQEAFRKIVRAFVREEMVPRYDAWQEAGCPDRAFWHRCGELGILGIDVPEEYGGMPGSRFTHSVIVTEEIQREFLAVGGLRVQTDICMPYFLSYASDEQKARWLPQLTRGDAISALAMSEPGAGSDVKSMSTRAVRDGDHYVINGAKTFISNGTNADLVILAAKTDPAAGRRGISLIVVEAGTPGFERGRKLDKLGLKAQDLSELSFSDARVPVANLLGQENCGFEYLTSNLAQERISIAVNSQAAASAMLAYVTSQVAGTGAGQLVKFALADCATEIAAGQALVDSALAQLETGTLLPASAAMAKLYCTELQGRALDRCIQILGPAGYPRMDCKITRAYLDGRVSRIYAGSSEIMKVIISQSLGV